ncbi:hypothetical protein A6E15_07755 [Natrinema saccharevitans]|uniref:Uncharacterized protein n=1 Tax=Natrinema saccharevitans TaxID=301967 RepID=A0A1S8AW44_9EURY|nr:hypothetical protein [Natrinema saccharevitans]OLZ40892.1 hypothetical protein A6E15_07755 [Natrinema saccharevitans]
MAVAASVLVLVNMVTINITSLAVLWYKGYRPDDWFQQDEARVATAKRTVVLAVTILVLSAPPPTTPTGPGCARNESATKSTPVGPRE